MRPSAGGDSEHVGTLAGTLGPRNEVRFCVDVLGARRIAHGVLAADDGTLIAHLANLKVCSEPGNSNTFTESHSESSRIVMCTALHSALHRMRARAEVLIFARQATSCSAQLADRVYSRHSSSFLRRVCQGPSTRSLRQLLPAQLKFFLCRCCALDRSSEQRIDRDRSHGRKSMSVSVQASALSVSCTASLALTLNAGVARRARRGEVLFRKLPGRGKRKAQRRTLQEIPARLPSTGGNVRYQQAVVLEVWLRRWG